MNLEEVIHRTDRLQTDFENLRTRTTEIEKQVHADNVHKVNVERRLSNIEDTLKWIVRLIIGGIILAMLGFALQGGTL